jgi:hypothetical protein
MVEVANNIEHPKGRFSHADPKGGIKLIDETNQLTNLCKDLAKTFVKKMITGSFSDALKMRTPAYTHAPLSYIDCVKFEFSFIEEFLLLAHERGVLENPVERLKYITAAQLATIHYGITTMGLRRPLNPILGETGMSETSRGSRLYLE